MASASHHDYTPNPALYTGNPLAHAHSNSANSIYFAPFAGALQPGLYRPPKKNIANPAPLGLAAFALTTFVLSLINWHTRDVSQPNIVVALSFGYGGLVQLLAGMWYVSFLTPVGSCKFNVLRRKSRLECQELLLTRMI